MNEQRKLDNKVTVITIGGSGIGLAAARLFHQHGAQLVLAGQDEAKLDAAAELLGGPVRFVACDLSTSTGVDRLIDAVEDRFGFIDVLLVDAGTVRAPEPCDVDDAAFDEYINVHLKSAFFTVTRARDLLNDNASVILTAAAYQCGGHGTPLHMLTRAALTGLARSLAADTELLARGIRVNSLSPGSLRTPSVMCEDPAARQAMDARVTATVPMRRLGTTEEAARAALYLAGPDSSCTTGSDLPVDGGLARL
ncbi:MULTISPECIES: SDR family NAD(P)-dependent oxidoreductase [unclassified Streptomyces]|uniref:SDR family NAD(P)-dependent oxidoreductase n=1 Tax=unclassified Streptomyces TaxID=2593676 RepID=UPI00380F6C41